MTAFQRIRLSGPTLVAALLIVLSFSGCQALKEVANLRNVNFALDGIRSVTLAGVDMSAVRSYDDLSPRDLIRLGSAVRNREVPLAFNAVIRAENPQANSVNARLVEMDWMLFLDEQETVRGLFSEQTVLRPGEPQQVNFPVEVELVQFVGSSLPELVNLVLAVAGEDGASSRIQFDIQPTIETPLGPMRYPNPIRVVDQNVGTTP